MQLKTRIIVASTESGEKEQVFFTRIDFTSPAESFFTDLGLTIDADFTEFLNFPNTFPFEYTLKMA